MHHKIERSLVCVCGKSGKFSWSSLTKDIKMGSCVLVWHSTSMDGTTAGWPRVCILWQVGCHALCFWHTIPGWKHSSQNTLQAGTVMIWPHMFKSDVKPKQTNKQTDQYQNMETSVCSFHRETTSNIPFMMSTLHNFACTVYNCCLDLISTFLNNLIIKG